MMIHEVTAKVGGHKKQRRVGRGPSSGRGKTCGRGHKGAGSRSGWSGSIRASREGGQTPFFRRIPKRGFSNAKFRRQFALVNVKALEARFPNGAEINAETLAAAGLVRDKDLAVKLLGEGEVTKKFSVAVAAASKSAMDKIIKAGGSVSVVG